MPWSAADHAEMEADTNDLLGECGLPARPAGRVWLLRPPPGYLTLDDAVSHLLAAAEESGADVMASPRFVVLVDAELRRLFASTP